MVWSAMYVEDGAIQQIGNYDSYEDALEAARAAYSRGDYDIEDQYAYILAPNGCLTSLLMEEVQA